jgi:hypothetical protein
VKEKPYPTLDEAIAEIAGKSIAELVAMRPGGPHLITVDELRAAGALDVPPSWRKSLSAGVKRDQLPLFGDDDSEPTNEELASSESDGDISEDEAS